jgi:O-antigen/teichoic acid export membrane protein
VTSRDSRLVLAKNAFANVARGSSAALVALILPPFLVRSLSTDEFGIWILVLQLSAYTNFLDFGLQTAVGRFVAYTNELKDINRRNTIISTALAALIVLGCVGTLMIIVLACQIANLFPNLQSNLYFSAKMSLLIVGISTAIGLPFSVFGGIFIGLQRYEIPAIIIGGSKLVSGFILIIVATQFKNIILMSITIASINLLSYVILYKASNQMVKDVVLSYKLISKKAAEEIISYCSSLSVWSFSMLLVSGIDTTLVGMFEFKKVAYYGVSISIISFVSGLQTSIFSTLVPAAAVLNAREKSEELGELLIKTTRYGLLILLITGLPLITLSRSFFNTWLGESYGIYSTSLLQILIVANIIRLAAVPYSTILLGTGQQSLVILSPLIEGTSNLLMSIVLGIKFGAVGVALGTLIGAIIGVGFHYFYNMKRSTSISCNRSRLLRKGILLPIISTLPILLIALIAPISGINLGRSSELSIVILAFSVTLFTTWTWGITQSEKKASILFLGKIKERHNSKNEQDI